MSSIAILGLFAKIVRWLLLIVTILYFASGFGIAEFRIVEGFTFGMFTKPIASKLHNALWGPFIGLLLAHMLLPSLLRLLKSIRPGTGDNRNPLYESANPEPRLNALEPESRRQIVGGGGSPSERGSGRLQHQSAPSRASLNTATQERTPISNSDSGG